MSTRGVVAALFVSLCASCALPGGPPPGMRETQRRAHPADPSLIELARLDANASERALLVVYPRTSCSGSASGVLVDEQGRFLGAIAPGTAALISIPKGTRTITAFSSVEVTAPAGAWFATDEVAVPSQPGGLLLRSSRSSARQCGNGQYFDVVAATKERLEHELEESEVRWFEVGKAEGQAWLDAHRARVDDLLGRRPLPPPNQLTRIVIR
jgi:hypothetical protein